MNYLSICCIAKDEDQWPDHRGKTYIDDFIDMHRFLGVEFFYIYDQGGSLLLRYKNVPDVRVLFYPRPKLQADCYKYHIENHLNNSVWTLFLDVDEFLLPDRNITLQDLLLAYDKPKVGAVQFNWKVFGSNGHITKPKDLSQFEAFTKREDPTRDGAISRHTKVALKGKAAAKGIRPADPHHFRLNKGYRAVNSNGNIIVPQPLIEPIYNEAAVYHYVTRSHQEYEIKIKRNRVDFIEAKEYPNIEHLDSILNIIEDTRAKDLFYLMTKHNE